MAEPYQMPDPYQPPDPYDTAADPSQIDWPQDTAAEEPAVDDYDDGYDPQAYTDFQDDLAPYGNWIDDGTYGRVWQPEGSLVGAEFTPYYTGGHWALTEFGWTWVSDFSWGWAPFHYGRWIVVSGYGWCWVPGSIWGPAWVAWRAGDGYVGWAALPPRGVSVAVTYGPRSPWRFSRAADLNAPRPRCIPTRDARGMFHRTTLVTNDRVLTRGGTTVHINAGPRHVNSAVPVRLTAVAPQAFPQRAILPHRGATMSARPVDPRRDRRRRGSREQRRRRPAAWRGRTGRSERGTGRRPDAHVRSGAGADRARVALLVVRVAPRLQPTATGRTVGAREQPARVRQHRAPHLQPARRERRAAHLQPGAGWQRRAHLQPADRRAPRRASTTRRPRTPRRTPTASRRRTARRTPTASRRRMARRTRSAGRRRRSTIRRRARSRARRP